MVRREMLSMLGAGATGLAAMAGGAAWAVQDQKKAEAHKHEHGEGHDHAHGEHGDHDVMAECAQVCNETAHHCLQQAHQGGEGQHLHLHAHAATMDCQAFCHLTSALAARHSRMAGLAHQACAEACKQCAEVCDKGQDEVMKRCAEICRQCEQHCREHAKAGHAGGGHAEAAKTQ